MLVVTQVKWMMDLCQYGRCPHCKGHRLYDACHLPSEADHTSIGGRLMLRFRCIVVILGFQCEMNVWPVIRLLIALAMQWTHT